MYIIKANTLILHGRRNYSDGLWDVRLPRLSALPESQSYDKPAINYIITNDKSQTNLARYYHAALFSPPISTLTRLIANGNLVTWPGIETLPFKKLLDTTLALEKGHLDQERSNLQSTQLPKNDTNDDYFPPKEMEKTYQVFAMLERTDEEKFQPK